MYFKRGDLVKNPPPSISRTYFLSARMHPCIPSPQYATVTYYLVLPAFPRSDPSSYILPRSPLHDLALPPNLFLAADMPCNFFSPW